MIMKFAVGQASLFVMSGSQEWFFTFCADEMLHVPLLAQSSHNTVFNRTPASAAYGHSMLVVASKAKKAATSLSGASSQFRVARGAVEVVRVERLALVDEMGLIDDLMAFVANVAPRTNGALSEIAFSANGCSR